MSWIIGIFCDNRFAYFRTIFMLTPHIINKNDSKWVAIALVGISNIHRYLIKKNLLQLNQCITRHSGKKNAHVNIVLTWYNVSFRKCIVYFPKQQSGPWVSSMNKGTNIPWKQLVANQWETLQCEQHSSNIEDLCMNMAFRTPHLPHLKSRCRVIGGVWVCGRYGPFTSECCTTTFDEPPKWVSAASHFHGSVKTTSVNLCWGVL